jgi:hypothetical protein
MKVRSLLGGPTQVVHVERNETIRVLQMLGIIEEVFDKPALVVRVSWSVSRGESHMEQSAPIRIEAYCSACRGKSAFFTKPRETRFVHCRVDQIPEEILQQFEKATAGL